MTLRVAIPDLVSPSYFPAIAAVELGFFKKEGLDATIELLFPVTRTYEELRDGRLDFVAGRRACAALRVQELGGMQAPRRARAAHVLVPGPAQGPRARTRRPGAR